MPRTPNTPATPADLPELVPTKVAEIVAMQNAAPSLSDQDALVMLGRQIGQIEAAAFIGNISDGVMLSAYENVKKSKTWMRLESQKTGNTFPSLDAFCQERLGYSARRLAQITGNRELIGKEAFAQAEALGLRQVDYNSIKSLPAPDQELIRRAVEEAQSRDEVLSLLQELAGKHGKERQELTQALNEERLEHAATQDLLAEKDKRINALKKQQQRIQQATPEEVTADLLTETATRAHTALAYVRGDLRLSFQALQDRERSGESHRHVMAGYLDELELQIAILRADFFLPAAPQGEAL